MAETNKYFGVQQDADRVDGIAKVTGAAKYTADQYIPGLVYGVFICSTVPKGFIKELDAAKALSMPGVLDVISYKNCPPVPGYSALTADGKKNNGEWRGFKVFSDNKVWFHGQPVALLVADSLQNAWGAIKQVKISYETEPFNTDFDKARKDPAQLKKAGSYKRGEQKAYLKAPVWIEAEYNTPIEVHNPMEMQASIAYWEAEDKLTIYDKTQGPKGTQGQVARAFGVPEKNVRVITEFVGGAFGNALRNWANLPAAIIAAKKLNRPVKVMLTRPQMFTMTGYRPQSWQKIGIGAANDGRLLGISHEAVSNTSRYEDFREGIVDVSKFLYACDNVDTEYATVALDLSTPTWMRGPGEATGCYGLECALDELSYKLKMDPVALRKKNFTAINPENKMPWSAKNLIECYDYGMEKIGWSKRPKTPGTLKEKGMLVGYGMAGGVFGAWKGAATVKAILKADGTIELQSAVSDMGPGTATSMVKIAAAALSMPLNKIRFVLGDSNLPPGPSQGGSGTTAALGNAVSLACDTLKKSLKEYALQQEPSFKEMGIEDLEVKEGRIVSQKNSATISFEQLLKKLDKPAIEILQNSPGTNPMEMKHATNSFSVHFVKVQVDPKTGVVKLLQIVTMGDAGRIISENTASSQMLGGAVGGIGMALKEGLKINHATGAIENANLFGYHLPVHTDIPQTDVWFVNKPDPIANALGAKGVGEIALIGFAAAVANAVYNATGKRVRDLPITKESLVG